MLFNILVSRISSDSELHQKSNSDYPVKKNMYGNDALGKPATPTLG